MTTPTINLQTKTIYVDPRIIKNRFTIKQGTPYFGMCWSLREKCGLRNPIKYWWWKRQMRKNWNKK